MAFNREASKRYAKTEQGKRAIRRGNLKLKFNLSERDYNALLTRQEGLCAICRLTPATHVDHNHQTSTVRGLLCHLCNAVLGDAKDSMEILRKAEEYLRKWGK